MKDEYRFDYTAAKPNRFTTDLTDRQIMVALDPDVTAVFRTGEQVNQALRALIQTIQNAGDKPNPELVDLEDLLILTERQDEPTISHADLVAELKSEGILPD